MYLTKLTINGFKSFAQKIELKFDTGVTAIVGPNGSGKSNIADAVRWSLGEQSVKSIRGKKTSDIIFAGSDKKSRLSMAEVSLFFNNEDGRALIDFSEFSLTRRFYRSGEGEYILNDNKARLSDIQILLAKANIGSKTYSVIGQGQIDAVLTATPIERKDFFDEATGVKQFQIKRDQSLNKLEKAWANMQQGNLMLTEIEPRLRSLTRQVKRLEQKEQVNKELFGLQRYYYYDLWFRQNKDEKKLNKEKSEFGQEKNKLESLLNDLYKQIDSLASGNNQAHEFESLQNQYESKQLKRQEILRELATWEGRRDLDLEQSSGGEAVWVKKRLQKLIETKESYIKDLDKITVIKNKLDKSLILKEQQQEKLSTKISEFENDLLLKQEQASSQVSFKEAKISLHGIADRLKNLQVELDEARNLTARSGWLKFIGEVLVKINSLISYLPSEKNDDQIQVVRLEQINLQKKQADLLSEIYELKSEQRVTISRRETISSNLQEVNNEINQLTGLAEKYSSDDISTKEKELKDSLLLLDQEMSNINTKLQKFNHDQQSKKDELFSLQEKSQDMQKQLSQTNNNINQIEVELARIETRLEDLALEVHRELNIFLAGLIDEWKNHPPQIAEDLSNEEMIERINSLKKKKEMIGGTPPETMSEYSEVKGKYDFLTSQSKDLNESIQKLIVTLDELDQIIYKQFTDNFGAINELFNRYFRMLFNGGRAELTLLKEKEDSSKDKNIDFEGEEELDESQEEDDDLIKKYKKQGVIKGIDIKATPPGKKMKGIGMLSGGERALTSIALICAMIANNPSPFVVLDEVDAALDEANSLRFAEILAELSKQTQFIVITHNRATMEKADILYGVTMGSDGTSNLLSVKFDEAERFANRY